MSENTENTSNMGKYILIGFLVLVLLLVIGFAIRYFYEIKKLPPVTPLVPPGANTVPFTPLDPSGGGGTVPDIPPNTDNSKTAIYCIGQDTKTNNMVIYYYSNNTCSSAGITLITSFKAYTTQQPGTIPICINTTASTIPGPPRFQINIGSSSCVSPGWEQKMIFYAYPKKYKTTIPMCVSNATTPPDRSMITHNATTCNSTGWTMPTTTNAYFYVLSP